MTTYAAQLDFEAVFRPPSTCPACGTADLVPADDGGRANFHCAACGRCWHCEMGWLSLVDPRDCAQCERRQQCLAQPPGAARGHERAGAAARGGAPCGSA